MRALSAASVALVAATLALVACAVTPAAASLLKPLQQRHADPRRGPHRRHQDNLQSVGKAATQWVFNGTSLWNSDVGIFNVRHSDVQPDHVLGYAAGQNGIFTPSVFFALNATTGAALWHTRISKFVPQQCTVGFEETATTVACLGADNFAIVNRATGALVANGQYAAGFQVAPAPPQPFRAATPPAKRQARRGDVVAVALVSSNATVGKVVALDLTSGAVTPMGEATSSGRTLNAPFLGALRANGNALELNVTWWATAPAPGSIACNVVFTFTFSTRGNATLVARLPASFGNDPVGNFGFCQQPVLFAYPDDDVVFGVLPEPGNVTQAYHLNGTFRFAVQLPMGPDGTVFFLKLLKGERGDAILFESMDTLAVLSTSNTTLWADPSFAFASAAVIEIDEDSLTVGGVDAGFLVNVSLATGYAHWGCALSAAGSSGINGRQITPLVDVFMDVVSDFFFVRKSDGVLVANFNTQFMWSANPFTMNFRQWEGAPAGTGTLLVGGYWGDVMSVAVTAEP